MAVPVYIPTNSAGGFPFSTPPPALVICGLTSDGHSDWCEVVSHGSFDLHFTNTQWNTTKHKKDEIMPSASTGMQLESFILSEVSQKEKEKYYISLIFRI